MPETPLIAASQCGAFTRDQAIGAGWTRGSLAHAVGTGRLLRPRRGVYASTQPISGSRWIVARDRLALNTAAALLAQSGSVASHRSAAVLAGLPLLITPGEPCITVAPGRHSVGVHTHTHRADLPPEQTILVGLLVRTSSTRTVIDVARDSSLDEAVVVADAALQRGLTDHDRLRRQMQECRNWPGIGRATLMLGRCDGRAESPLESISRLRLAETDLPTPTLQAAILDEHRTEIARCDFLWPEFGVVGEADGMEKYDGTPSALRAEKIRQERLERAGLVVVRWGWPDLADMPALRHRLRWALDRGARSALADRRWSVRAG